VGADPGRADGCAQDDSGLSGGNEMRFADVVMFIAFLTSLSFLWGIVDGTIQVNKIVAQKECGK